MYFVAFKGTHGAFYKGSMTLYSCTAELHKAIKQYWTNNASTQRWYPEFKEYFLSYSAPSIYKLTIDSPITYVEGKPVKLADSNKKIWEDFEAASLE